MSTVIATFAPEASLKTSREDLASYVAAEIRRLFDSGAAVLLAIHQFGVDDDARMLAMEMLTRGEDDAGERIYPVEHQWRLRLKDGAKPPLLDPQGRKIEPDAQGKVLRAKVGLLGASRGRDHVSAAAKQWDGNARAAKSMSMSAPLHVMRDITSKPTVLTLREAALVLSRWGVGCTAKQYLRPPGWVPGQHSTEQGQDTWLVEEVPAAATAKTRAA